MAQTTIIRITHDKLGTELGSTFRLALIPSSNPRSLCLGLAALFERIAAGMEPGVTVDLKLGGTAAVAASGTMTISGGSGDIVTTISGVAKTVTWASSDTATAAAVAAAINADATLKKLVAATSALGVVTVTALAPGVGGNSIALSVTGTGASVSAAALASGAGDDVTSVIYVRS